MRIKSKTTLSLDELRERVSDSQLLNYYLGINTIPCLINSPLRTDRHPSFGIYEHCGKVYWKDLANKDGGSIYDLLSRMWGTTFVNTLDRVVKDLDKIKGTTTGSNIREVQYNIIRKPTCKDLQVKVREWRDYDIEYWASYGVPLKWLKYADVYPISHKIVITTDNQRYVFGAQKYAYAYVERKDGKVTIKVYQPLSPDPRHKWSNKHDRSVISLWTKVPKRGDKIVICSSLKDALCLWANTGIPAIAVQGEGYNISDSAIKSLKERYKNIYILFDNDNAGLADGKSLAQKTGFNNVQIPQFIGGKDVSDYYKIMGKETFIELFTNLLKTQTNDKK